MISYRWPRRQRLVVRVEPASPSSDVPPAAGAGRRRRCPAPQFQQVEPLSTLGVLYFSDELVAGDHLCSTCPAPLPPAVAHAGCPPGS